MVVPDEVAAKERRSSAASAASAAPPGSGRRASLLSIAVFDVGGPLAVYYSLRSAGTSTVVALVVSGLLPAIGIGLSVRRHRRIDVIGVVVLGGIILGTVVGLVSGSARLVLIDGTVPTAVLGLACFGSFLTSRPLMFRVALQFMGPESEEGRGFAFAWKFRAMRRAFTVITVVWGLTFLAETGAQILIIEYASINTAKTTSNVLPIIVAAVVAGWTSLYGRRQRGRVEREATQTASPATPADATPADATADHATPASAAEAVPAPAGREPQAPE
jgi:hypothetical protein